MAYYSALKRKLERSEHAPLVELIDWDNTERRSATKIVVLTVLAFLPFAASMAVSSWIQWRVLGLTPEVMAELPMAIQVLVPLVGAPFMFLAFWLTARAFRAARAEISKFPEHALFASRKPTLYLREFREENEEWADFVARTEGDNLATWFHRRFAGMRDWTVERRLVLGVARLGPMLALRDPQQRRQPGEARRLQILGPRWQEAVNHLLPDAGAVVLIFGAGQSVSWEATRVLEQTRLPTFVWMPALANPLPPWIAGPRERHQWQGDEPTSPKAGYLFYFDENRHVTAKKINNWLALTPQIRRIIRRHGIVSEPNPHRRAFTSPLVGLIEKVLWVLPYVVAATLVVAIIYFMMPGFADTMACLGGFETDRCQMQYDRIMERAKTP